MKHLDSTEIIRLLEPPTDSDLVRMQEYFEQSGDLPKNHGSLIKNRIRKEAPVRELIAALRQSTSSHVREVSCDLLGELHAKTAVSILIACLEDPSVGVRSSAADALAKIRSPQAGKALMKRFAGLETEVEVQRMLALALGAIRYRPAIPLLIKALASSDPDLRGSAAWSLGVLRASEAVSALEQAFNRENKVYPRERIKMALDTIQQTN